jgi:putative peptidoglycan lipid II flippase
VSGTRSEGIVRTTSVILAVVVVSKVLGMVREMLLASRLGNGPENSAYSVAFSLVFTLTLLFSCFLQTAFQPIYSRVRFQDGQREADRYASGMLTFFGLAGLGIGILLYLFAPQIASVYMPGYSSEGQALVAQMIRLLTPMFVLQVAAYLLTALLNANESFIVPHLATMSLSFALIPTLAFTRSGDPRQIALAVALATSASAVLEVLIQLPAASRRLKFRPVLQPRDPLLHQTLFVALPAVIATGSSEINQLLQKNLTSTINEDAASALVFGYKTYAIYVGLLILPITVILFSRLGKLSASDDRPGMLALQRRTLEAMMLVLIPVVLLSMVLHRDIIRCCISATGLPPRIRC